MVFVVVCPRCLLCPCVGGILIFLIAQSLFNRKNFWRYISHIDACLPEPHVLQNLEIAKDIGKNNLARARILLRLAMNDRLLSAYMDALLDNVALTQQHYEGHALLLHEEHRSTFQLLLHMLDTTQFMLWIKDPNLSELNYHATVLQVEPPERPTPVLAPKTVKESPNSAVLQSSEPFISPQARIASEGSLKRRSLEEDEAPSESPSVGEQLTASLWSIVCISLVKEEKQDGIYKNLLTQPCPYESQIDSDIHRVLTTVRFETGDGPKLLHNILKGFSLYHPELGYSQELAFVAATLLLQLEEEGSFWVLSWLSQKYMFEEKSLFSQDVTLLKFCLYILEQLVAKKVPDLGRHLVGAKRAMVLF